MKTVLIDKDENLLPMEHSNGTINCPICAMPDSCMVDYEIHRDNTDPISEKLLESRLTSYLCVSCGFTTNSDMVTGSDILKESLKNSPKLVVDLGIVDSSRGIAWFPAVMNIPKKGIIYPDGTPEDWCWVVSPYVPMNEEEYAKYVEDKDVSDKTIYSHRLAIEQQTRFPKLDFQDALNCLSVLMQGETDGKI